MGAVVVFCYFNCCKCSNIKVEYISSIIGLKIEVGILGGVRKVGFVFVVVGNIFMVVFMLLVIDIVG